MSWSNRQGWAAWLLTSALLLGGCASQQPMPEEGAGQPDEATRTAYQQALSELEAGHLDAARAELETLHQAYPELAGPAANLGLIAMQRGEDEQAETYFQQVLAIQPNHLHSLNALGVLARQQGDFDAAEGYYRAALTVNPDYQPALRNLGILLELYRGELPEALSLYEHYQSLQPEEDPRVKEWIFDLSHRVE